MTQNVNTFFQKISTFFAGNFLHKYPAFFLLNVLKTCIYARNLHISYVEYSLAAAKCSKKVEMNVMKAVNIKLSLAENVKSFVNIAARYPYDIDLRVGRHVVDGKSILGIFSLDLSKPITLEVYADDCDDLMEEIKPFIIG